MTKESVEARVARVIECVRRFGTPRIVAAVKRQPIEFIREALDAGLTELGVNQVQQGEELTPLLSEKKILWHFIGHIQSRKAKLLGGYDLVQSVDRLEVARLMNDQMIQAARTQRVLIEVNVGDEAQKSGVSVGQLDAFRRELAGFKNLSVCGLMVMPPFIDPPFKRAPYFKTTRRLFEMEPSFEILSMGTSTDYEVALAEGSNMVRLGTTIFGVRS